MVGMCYNLCHFFEVRSISQRGEHRWSPVSHFLFPQKSKSTEVLNFKPFDFMLNTINAKKCHDPEHCSLCSAWPLFVSVLYLVSLNQYLLGGVFSVSKPLLYRHMIMAKDQQ